MSQPPPGTTSMSHTSLKWLTNILDPDLTLTQMVKRLSQGVLSAIYTGIILSVLMVIALLFGVILVNYWVEQPVFVKDKLYFDYTNVNPHAHLLLHAPLRHRFRVSVSLLVPDSLYNRHLGVFQITAEVISTNGKVIAQSSQPSMLRYHSHPIRLMRTFLMGLPLMLGLTHETQRITVDMLNYKETSQIRTGAIKITLMPRAGTLYLPELYEAEIILQSKLPRLKEFIYKWKWSCYVWTSSYIYVLLLWLLVRFNKPVLVYPISQASVIGDRSQGTLEREEKYEPLPEGEDTMSRKKRQQYRKKRKAALLSTSKEHDEDIDAPMSASSYTVTKDDDVSSSEEDVGDSESVVYNKYKYEYES